MNADGQVSTNANQVVPRAYGQTKPPVGLIVTAPAKFVGKFVGLRWVSGTDRPKFVPLVPFERDQDHNRAVASFTYWKLHIGQYQVVYADHEDDPKPTPTGATLKVAD